MDSGSHSVNCQTSASKPTENSVHSSGSPLSPVGLMIPRVLEGSIRSRSAQPSESDCTARENWSCVVAFSESATEQKCHSAEDFLESLRDARVSPRGTRSDAGVSFRSDR